MLANKEEIRKALEIMLESDSVAELRIMGVKEGNYEATYSGYFNDFDKMADYAVKYSGKAPAIYFTLQQCKSALLARAANTLKKQKKQGNTTSDLDIECYRWFPIDCDAVRPAGISSTDAEHDQAIKRSRAIFKYLSNMGWPNPVVADSGNGSHLCYKINIPVDKNNAKEMQETIKQALLALSQKFSDSIVDIDKSVHNPSRIWKLYGTMAKKGDETEDRKHRLAKLLYCPDELHEVDFEKIKLLASIAIDEKKQTAKKEKSTYNSKSFNGHELDVVEWCAKHGISIKYDSQYQEARRYILDECPFDSNHKDSAIFQNENGAISFKCFHNSCQEYGWKELRAKFEPDCYDNQIKKSENNCQSYNNYNKPSTRKNQRIKISARTNVDGDKDKMFKGLELQMSGESNTIPLPWNRVSDGSKMLRPGSMTIIAGPTKAGKSFFTTNIIKHIHELGHEWAYLPLEDNRKDWMWRMLAIYEQDYRMIDDDMETAQLRLDAFMRNQSVMDEYLTRVTENPRSEQFDENGNMFVPEVDHETIIDWIKEMAPTHRVLVVDPISQIDGKGRETWTEESWFMRQALGIVSTYGISLIFVTHTVKRSGAAGQIAPTAEDVQGSSMFTKLAHTTLLVDACDMQEGEVYGIGGSTKTVNYDRVITIAAARNGKGTRWRIAYTQDKEKPIFNELGLLIPNVKKGKR